MSAGGPKNYRTRCTATSKLPGCDSVVEIANNANTLTANVLTGDTTLTTENAFGVVHIVTGGTTITVPDPSTVDPNRLLYILNSTGGNITIASPAIPPNGFISGINNLSATLTVSSGDLLILKEDNSATTGFLLPGRVWYRLD